MRSPKSRSRSKNNRNNNNRSGGGNVVNRVFDSSGPESKVRGTPQQIIDKYNQLARDSQLSGDRVATENFQQHAEHYLRMLGEAMREQEAKREQQEAQNRDRQAERDRERQERAERQERESNAPAQAHDPSQVPQPDLADAAGGDSGLVETPEASSDKPKPRRRTRKKAPVEDQGGAEKPAEKTPEHQPEQSSESGPEAAE